MPNMYTGIALPQEALMPQNAGMPPLGYGANPVAQMEGMPPVDLYTGRLMRAPSVAAVPSDMADPQLLGFAHQIGQFDPAVVGPQRQLGLLDPGYMMPSFSPEQYAMPYGLLGG